MKMRRRSHKKGFQQENIIKYITLLTSVFLGEKIGRTLLIISILAILTFLVSPNLIVTHYPKEEQVSPKLIKAPYDFLYEDKTITELNRKEAVAKV